MDITVPEELYECLDEMGRNADIAIAQNASAALARAMKNPKKYIGDNKEMLEQYQAIMASDEYKATPMYRLQELLKQLQRENGYNDIFIPAMQQLSPSYRKYYESLQAANEIFIKHYPSET